MKIDISDRIDAATKATSEWAEKVGYRAPDETQKDKLSKKGRDVVRILNTSEFGCQSRHVKALVEVLLGEKLPDLKHGNAQYEYESPHVGFEQGTMLVPSGNGAPWSADNPEASRAGMMVRVSKQGRVGLRYSNGEFASAYFELAAVRPANEQEIRDYFAEFYGAQFSKFDTIEEPDDDGEMPF